MMKSDQVDVVKVVTIFVMSVSLPIFADGPVDQGERLFNQNCVFCHQQDAIGTPGLAPSLTNPELLEISSDKFLMSTIRDGRKAHLCLLTLTLVVKASCLFLPICEAIIEKQIER